MGVGVEELKTIMQLVGQGGLSIVMFVVWFVYHKNQVEFLTKILDEQSKREDRNFQILKEATETLQQLTAYISRMEYKIDSNEWCPITKEGKK